MSKEAETLNSKAETAQNGLPGALTVTLDRITHRFGSRCVFRDVRASVAAGQVLIVSGANGAGKSTLLRIIAGLLQPTEGTVCIEIRGQTLDTLSRRHSIGYVAPDLVLYRELTGAENLEFFAKLHGLRLVHGDLVDLLKRVGLRGRGRDLVGTYSSGMRQRLKYAFALLHRPPILLLDEPTANLDTDGIGIVEGIVQAQQEQPGGGLTIVATNEPREWEWSPLRLHLEPQL